MARPWLHSDLMMPASAVEAVLRQLRDCPFDARLHQREPVAEPLREPSLEAAFEAGQVFRHRVGQQAQLIGDDRHQQHQGGDNQQADRCDDDRGSGKPSEPRALQPVGDRIEEVGDHHAGNERQQHLAQQCDAAKQPENCQDPEQDVPFDAHAASPSMMPATSTARWDRNRQPLAALQPDGSVPSVAPDMCNSQSRR